MFVKRPGRLVLYRQRNVDSVAVIGAPRADEMPGVFFEPTAVWSRSRTLSIHQLVQSTTTTWTLAGSTPSAYNPCGSKGQH